MNAVSQWWIGGLRTRKAKVAGSIPAGGSKENIQMKGFIAHPIFQYGMSESFDSNTTRIFT